jgi:hypothetical protein
VRSFLLPQPISRYSAAQSAAARRVVFTLRRVSIAALFFPDVAPVLRASDARLTVEVERIPEMELRKASDQVPGVPPSVYGALETTLELTVSSHTISEGSWVTGNPEVTGLGKSGRPSGSYRVAARIRMPSTTTATSSL